MNIEELNNELKESSKNAKVKLTVCAGEGNLLSLEKLVVFDYSWNTGTDGSHIEIAGDLDEYLDKLDDKHLFEFKEYIEEVVNQRLINQL